MRDRDRSLGEHRSRVRLCVFLIILNLCFIWGNSLLPGTVSGAISRWVQQVLTELLPHLDLSGSTGHGLLRKLAHFSEFTSLGLLLTWLFAMLGRKPWLSLLCGFPAACLDETIQYFVPGRGPGIRDVGIDFSGVLLGVLLFLLGSGIHQKCKRTK